MHAAMATPDRTGLEPLVELPFTNRVYDKPLNRFFPKATAATFAAIVAACRDYARRYAARDETAMGWTDPKACPLPQDLLEGPVGSDPRAAGVESAAPGIAVVLFPSHSMVLATWRLRYTDRWRLQAIDTWSW
jgi:hypothetical protein